MPIVLRHDRFEMWLRDLADSKHRARIVARIDRLAAGHSGDVKSVGSGVSELRCHFGPGFRVYFVKRGHDLIVLLGGGTKASQRKDIADAKSIAKELDDG